MYLLASECTQFLPTWKHVRPIYLLHFSFSLLPSLLILLQCNFLSSSCITFTWIRNLLTHTCDVFSQSFFSPLCFSLFPIPWFVQPFLPLLPTLNALPLKISPCVCVWLHFLSLNLSSLIFIFCTLFAHCVIHGICHETNT